MLSRDEITQALARLNALLAKRDQRAELCLVGGAVMCLVHQARPSTKDVDPWFVPTGAVREAALVVAEEMALSADWLNDGAKGFPANAGQEEWLALSHLTIAHVDAKTLLAMKCLAARGEEDGADIAFLAEKLGLESAEDILHVVETYYRRDLIPVRTQLLLEEMFP